MGVYVVLCGGLPIKVFSEKDELLSWWGDWPSPTNLRRVYLVDNYTTTLITEEDL